MLPQLNNIIDRNVKTIERYPTKTYKVDFSTKHISGYIDEIEAIKQSIYLMLSTERYAWLIYNWYYGVEFDTLIGKNEDYVNSEIVRRIKECLIEDDRITNVSLFELKRENDSLNIEFMVSTIYGDFDYRTEVIL